MTSQNKRQKEEIDDLKRKLKNSTAQITEYENKFIRTNLECDSCYYVLQKEFGFCPKCGKKVEKQIATKERANDNVFVVENDGEFCLIVGYKGFKDKTITIPLKINGRIVIGVWNKVLKSVNT